MTRFYLPPAEVAAVSPAFSASWNDTASMARRRMRTTKNDGTHATVTITENDATNPWNVGYRQYVSDPIDTTAAITGTIKGQLFCREILATANAYLAIVVRRFSGDGTTERGVMLALTLGATELVTAMTNRAISGSLSSVTGSVGDRIVIDIGVQFQNSIATNASGVIEFGDRWEDDLPENETFGGGTPAGASSWFEFSADVPFVTDDVASFLLGGTGIVAHETTPTSPRSTTTFDGGTFTNSLAMRRDRRIPNTTAKTIAMTATADVTYWRGVGYASDFLAAQVIPAGTWTLTINCRASAISLIGLGFQAYLFVLKPDGTKRSEIGFTSFVDVFNTSNADRTVTLSAGSVTFENQDRLGCEIEGVDLGNGAGTITLTLNLGGLTCRLTPPQTLLLGMGAAAFPGITQFDLDGWSNFLADLLVPQNEPTRTMTVVTRVRNRSGSTTRNIRAAIYTNTEMSGVPSAGTMVVATADIPVAASFNGLKTITIDTSALVVGELYWVVVAYDSLTDLSVFYYALSDIPTRQMSFTSTYGTWPTDPTPDFYFEAAPDYTYVTFQPEAVAGAVPLRTLMGVGL